MKNLPSGACVCVYIIYICMEPKIHKVGNTSSYLKSRTRVQSMRFGFINAVQSMGFGKEADILFQNPRFSSGLKSKL